MESNKPMGGTELMADRIYNSIRPDLRERVQIIHSRVRELDPNKKKILVLHDLPLDPECEHLKNAGWEKFDLLVFVSHWQQQMFNIYLGVPYSAGIVLKNAIFPIEDHEKPNDEKIRLIYCSTPHRGLDILYLAFNQLSTEYDNIELDVYSSFNLYGWPERDEPYRELFDKLRNHKKINYHKSVSNDEIREAMKRADIFSYPSVWQETSCLSLIEAMSAKLTCVHPSLAALPETSMGLTHMYRYLENKDDHAQVFYQVLKMIIESYRQPNGKSIMNERNTLYSKLCNNMYDMNRRKIEWNNIIESLLTL